MIIFWSWQSDTPKQIGHYFVRDALREAIAQLKADHELLEPAERDAAAALTLDSDRQGVPGSPDLAATIFEKIVRADVFVADVTLVGQTPDGKKLINSNVAIEYGHAHHALTFKRVLMVQNRHYGDGDELPFDLRQKSWPIHFNLAPDATKPQIVAERAKLKTQLVTALRPYLSIAGPSRPRHEPIPSTFTKAVFHAEGEILARNHAPAPDAIDYYFAQRRAMYLRLMPVVARDADLKQTGLYEDVLNRRIDLLLRNGMAAAADRNAYGAIAYEPHGYGAESLHAAFPERRTLGRHHPNVHASPGRRSDPCHQRPEHLQQGAGEFRDDLRRLRQRAASSGGDGRCRTARRPLERRSTLCQPARPSG
jgi:hypothetical protein